MDRPLPRVAMLGFALLAGLFAACLDELPRARSCGDGWWDREFEGCDPSSSEQAYLDACRQLGIDLEGACDPTTCEVVCCGDGVATGPEACDGNDVRGMVCPSGTGVVRCTDHCTLDYELCPAVCGDGVVSGTEECEKGVACGDDDDCGAGQSCYTLLGQCVPRGAFGPDLSCSNLVTTAHNIVAKPYASGTIGKCTSECIFGRDECGFCGDGQLDDRYFDLTWPNAEVIEFEAEVCDSGLAEAQALHAHCEPLCVSEPVNADVMIQCEVECLADCSGIAPPNDIIGGEKTDCCLAPDSPCPDNPGFGVPDLPCCSWHEHPEWMAAEYCVKKQTNSDEFVCP